MEHAGNPIPSTCADKWPPDRVDDVLSFAAREQWDCVGSALDVGFPVNAVGTWGPNSLLHLAAIHGFVPMVRRLLALGAHVDVRGYSQRTPAHYAAIYNRAEVLVVLAEAGADVNACDSYLNTPLHEAVVHSLPCTRNLLSLPQVDLAATDNNGHTSEQAARNYGRTVVANAVRAEVRAVSGRCADSSAADSLLSSAALQGRVRLPPTTRLLKASICNTLSCGMRYCTYVGVMLRQMSARGARWSPLRAAWVQAVVAGGAPDQGPPVLPGPPQAGTPRPPVNG
jgi:hypothetical protein